MKTTPIRTKLDPADFDAVKRLAASAGLTLSAWIAEAVREKAERQGETMTPPRKWGRPKKDE